MLKWNSETEEFKSLLIAHGATSNNGTKAPPTPSADIWGDWREEIIWRTLDNLALRIYTSNVPISHRMVTLPHDPLELVSPK